VKLFKTPRRSAAIVAGALVGLGGAVAIAAPASAHHPTVKPESACVNADGTWQVTWAVYNSESDLTAVLDSVEIEPAERSSITNIATGAILPVSGAGPLTGVQTLNKLTLRAKLTVQAHWVRDGEDIVQVDTARIARPTEKCTPSTPTPTPTTASPSPTPSQTSPSPTPSETTGSPTPSETTGSPSPSPSETAPAEAQWIYDETCDTLTVGVDVPTDWDDLTVTFTPSTGEAKTVTAPAGKQTVVDFPASEGLKVVASAKGYEDESATITYKTPADCDSAGGGGGEDGGSLPLTGAAAGSIAGGAAVLLAIGGALFFMARRRKVKFTA